MFIIGITGSMGCGKSTIAKMLEEKGALLLDSDQLARQVLEPGTEGLQEVVAHFGPGILDEQGHLLRKKLGEKVFANPRERTWLEKVVHPRIRPLQKKLLSHYHQQTPQGIALLDIPLLFETGEAQLCDLTVVVACGEKQWQRLAERHWMSDGVKQKAIQRQMPEAEKIQMAHRVIDNRGTLEKTRSQVNALWEEIVRINKTPRIAAWPEKWH
ncbi:MAG: dephospho-CoA kinase [Magnetococcales bacterium]|nr:dephospho-CoA kinase [Magnetococcales bacterium]